MKIFKFSHANSKTKINDLTFEEYLPVFKEILKLNHVYADSLGWVDPKENANKNILAKIKEQAERVQKIADTFVIIGVGGSNQGARAAIEGLNPSGKVEVVYAGNSLSAYEVDRLLDKLKNREVCINVIAKNFETLEPGLSFRVLRQFLKEKYGKEAYKRIYVTGTIGSDLEKLAEHEGYHFFDFPENMGGRYSVLSNVGLFPMAVAGLDIEVLVNGAISARNKLQEAEMSNPVIQYAALRNMLYRQGKTIEMLSFFEPRLHYFSKWWIQLFAESEGKDGQGIFPVAGEYSEDLHSVGQFVQDGNLILFETFLKIKNEPKEYIVRQDLEDGFEYLNGKDIRWINKSAEEATILAHSKKLPCLELEIDQFDEESLGGLFYYFMFSCYLSGTIQKINPFDQPGVEAYKEEMFKILKG